MRRARLDEVAGAYVLTGALILSLKLWSTILIWGLK